MGGVKKVKYKQLHSAAIFYDFFLQTGGGGGIEFLCEAVQKL